MITFLNKKQLAFILEIPSEEARAKMCVAWCKVNCLENKAEWNDRGHVVDSYPDAMLITLLSDGLSLPSLQQSVNDINENYLIRPATRKWILCDWPEKKIRESTVAGRPKKVTIPPGLKSLLPEGIIKQIKEEWEKRYADQGILV